MENTHLFQNKHMKNDQEDDISSGGSNNSNQNFNDEKLENEFKDLEGVTIKKLKIGLWFIERREKFRKAILYFLILLSIASWGYVIGSVVYYFGFAAAKDDLMIRQMVTSNGGGLEYLISVSPQNLVISEPLIYDLGNGKFDFVSQLSNPNKNYYAQFTYSLEIGGQFITKENGFILPDEMKYLMLLGKELTYRPANASIIISNISWQRINKHKIRNWSDYRNLHLNFVIDNVNFVGSRDMGISQATGMNNLEFEITNKTPFNYWMVNLPIILNSNETIVSVNRYGLAEFMSGNTKKIKMSWPGVFDHVTNITIIPDLDIMADDIYIKFQGKASQEE